MNDLYTSIEDPGAGRPFCPGGGADANHVARARSFPPTVRICKISPSVQELMVNDLHRCEMA